MDRKDAMRILNITQDDLEVAKAAFRSLSKVHHPDKGGDGQVFQEINDAYEVLKKPPQVTEESSDLFSDFVRRSKEAIRKNRKSNKRRIDKTAKVPIPEFYTKPVKTYKVSYGDEKQHVHEFAITIDTVTVLNWSLPNSSTEFSVTLIPQAVYTEYCSVENIGLDVVLTVDRFDKDYLVTPIKGIVITRDSEEYTLDNMGLSNGRTRGNLIFRWKR